MLGEGVRSTGFWSLDTLKGSPIRKRVSELDKVKKEHRSNDEALDKLFRHAISAVLYYKTITRPDIALFPVVSKKEYMADFEAFRSKEYMDEDKLHEVYTSGSTGTPFMAFLDSEKMQWHQAGLINLNRSIGWNLGD